MCRRFILLGLVLLAYLGASVGPSDGAPASRTGKARAVVASDTILSGMIASLLPPQRYSINTVLPPGQCPGHYDVKPSDIEKIRKADLVVSFQGMPFMKATGEGGQKLLLVDAEDRNWMAPEAYLLGLNLLSEKLSERFPEDRNRILGSREKAVREVREGASSLLQRIKRAGLGGKPLIASSMQQEPLEWMGFHVVGAYGRPEAMSPREVVRLTKIGREQQAVAVVDNLQSGPDAGKGIAEALGIPHVVLTNFPSEQGYLATLGGNIDTLTAVLNR